MKWAFTNTDTLLVPPQKMETIDTASKNNKIFTLKHRYTQMYTYIHTQHMHIHTQLMHTQYMYIHTQHPCNSPQYTYNIFTYTTDNTHKYIHTTFATHSTHILCIYTYMHIQHTHSSGTTHIHKHSSRKMKLPFSSLRKCAV